jgi:integrase/recombinase XerD
VTHLRRVMLEELQRRNYAKTTVQCYIQAVERFAKHFKRSPDQLNQDHLRTYQAYLLRERKHRRQIASPTHHLPPPVRVTYAL